MLDTLLQLRATEGFLASLSEADLTGLEQALSESSFEAGSLLISKGTVPDQLYLLLEGRVSVEQGRGKQGSPLMKRHGPGEFIGMQAFFAGGKSESDIPCF